MSDHRPLDRGGLAHLLVVYLAWGSTYLGIRLAVSGEGGFPPFTMAGLRVFAAAAVLLAVGLMAGMAIERSVEGGRPPGSGSALAAAPLFVREAAAAHAVFVPEKRHPVEVTAADEAHLVQWLSRRLGAPLKAPSLGAHGYHLLGGRLLPGEGTPRAQFMYENQQGSRVTLFVAAFAADAAPSETAFRLVRDGARTSFYWVEDRYGYALSADGSEAEVRVLVSEVYAQLNR